MQRVKGVRLGVNTDPFFAFLDPWAGPTLDNLPERQLFLEPMRGGKKVSYVILCDANAK